MAALSCRRLGRRCSWKVRSGAKAVDEEEANEAARKEAPVTPADAGGVLQIYLEEEGTVISYSSSLSEDVELPRNDDDELTE